MAEVQEYYQGKRPEVVDLISNSPRRILEIGCGDGSFRLLLKGTLEYWGVEPFSEAAELAHKNIDNVFNSTYETALSQLPNNYFDLIICNDVIEHFADHDVFFSSIKTKMSKDSYIVGSIPNVRHIRNIINLIFRKDWMYKDDGILDRTHLRFFTEKSLKRTFKRHGYTLETLKYIQIIKPKFFPPRRLFYNILILILGKDTRPLQFGFRIKLKD
jgi:2-polyprenyl-3-methyl-5-hydroxy-6-metoxy-1,4-benzoquinol methylase